MSATLTPSLDLTLCLVIGPQDTGGRPMRDVVLAAVEGGVTMVQLRWKDASTRAFVEAARVLLAALRPLHIPLIVNDRVDVALAVGADGVHVGQDDMPVSDARRLLGPMRVVGLSVTSLDDARALDSRVVNYAGVGPVFSTPTKPDAAPALGIAGTAEVVRALDVPSIAIGGINAGNSRIVRGTGVAGIAVVSAIAAAPDPGAAAHALAERPTG